MSQESNGMTGNDPYHAPQANLETDAQVGAEEVLASRGSRLAAAIVDGLLLMVIVLPVMFLTGIYEGFADMEEPSFASQVASSAFGFAVWLALNVYLLRRYGQTIGKRALGIKIVRMDGGHADLTRLVGYRYLPFQVLYLVPGVGQFIGLANVLFIFGSARRCLHDYLADTQVIKA